MLARNGHGFVQARFSAFVIVPGEGQRALQTMKVRQRECLAGLIYHGIGHRGQFASRFQEAQGERAPAGLNAKPGDPQPGFRRNEGGVRPKVTLNAGRISGARGMKRPEHFREVPPHNQMVFRGDTSRRRRMPLEGSFVQADHRGIGEVGMHIADCIDVTEGKCGALGFHSVLEGSPGFSDQRKIDRGIAIDRGTEVLTEMANIVGAGFLGMTMGCARCHDHKFDPIRQSDYYRLQGYFAQTKENDVVIATPEEQAKHKAVMEPLETEMRKLRVSMRRASEEDKGKILTRLEEIDGQIPPPLTAMYAVKNDSKDMTQIHMLQRGDYRNKGPKVGMRPPGVLLPDGANELPLNTGKPRLKLAEWITEPANPLTARVMANRIFGFHFGRPLVTTPNDFGKMGTRPANPELLDWLANEYVKGGWKMKPLHRLILLSSAYRQDSRSVNEKAYAAKDPENKWLWKANRRRLEAEEIRDTMLAISGRLNTKAGGPSVMVAIDPELIKDLKRPQYWVPTRDKTEHDRRTIYMIYKRNLILPFMQVFDSPDTLISCARRDQSTHAPQALELLNGTVSNDLALSLAKRLTGTPRERVDSAFKLAAGRLPNERERLLSLKYLDDPDPSAATEFALSLFNSNAFLYVD